MENTRKVHCEILERIEDRIIERSKVLVIFSFSFFEHLRFLKQ